MKTERFFSLVLVIGLAFSLTPLGCGDDDDTDGTSGDLDTDTDTDSDTDTDTDSDTDTDTDSDTDSDTDTDIDTESDGDAGVTSTVGVDINGTNTDVDVSTIPLENIGGIDLVLIKDIIKTANPDAHMEDYNVDFVASDGFQPSTKSNCADALPIDAKNAKWMGIDLADDNTLKWDENELDLPGCAGVKDVATILVTDK